jgi:hypothetical protein
VGPIGYFFESRETFSGGGFESRYHVTHKLELIETNRSAVDGTTFKAPPWQEATPLNTPRYSHASAVLDGRIYVIGGVTTDYVNLNSVEIYDPASNTWVYGTPIPVPVFRATAEVIDGKIYVFTPGRQYTVWYYDPADDQWWSGAQMVYDDQAHGSAAIPSEPLIAIVTPNGSQSGLLRVLYYNPADFTWLEGTPVQWSDHRWFSVAARQLTDATFLYIVGGYRQFASQKVYDSALRYEIYGRSWDDFVGTLNTPRYHAAAVDFNGRVTVLGGTDGNRELRSVESVSHETGYWSEMPSMMRPRKEFDAVVLNGQIYAIGGKSGDYILASVEVYTPE